MGWFDDLVEDVGKVATAIVTAPGNPVRSIQVIGEVAKKVLTQDENIPRDITEQMIVIQDNESFSDSVLRLPRKLEYLAKRMVEEARKLTGLETKGQHVVQDTFTGLWTNPVGLSPENRPSEPIYNRVSLLVSRLGIPAYYYRDDEPRDLVKEIAAIIFQDISPSLEQGVLLRKTKVIELEKNSSLTVSHVYYIIPMGVPGEQFNIHSAIHIAYNASTEQRLTITKAREECNFVRELDNERSWLVTVRITWSTSPTAFNAQQTFQEYFRNTYPHLKITMSVVLGVYQILKVQGPLKVTPEVIRTAVQDSAQWNVPIDRSRKEKNQIPLTAQNVTEVLKMNEIVLLGDYQARHSSWVDCIAER